MGKSRGPGNVPNRPIYSRISYLYQAATYLASQSKLKEPNVVAQYSEGTEKSMATADKQRSCMDHTKHALSRRFTTDLRSASLKSQIRLSSAMKHTICKFCDSLLIEGETSSSTVENKSRGGKKPWADVLVVKCYTCGGVKHFPVQSPRQKRRPIRENKPKEMCDSEKRQADVVMEVD
ncbi:Rpr2-domain-containing protein [Jackrogersella minutella]|nr:Rpr2-domain-containing protein [Jackrogersella minutella]